jgi:HD-GYP domain-containing protein (c-di-GMP phosphodiesterase class II)
VTLLSSRVTPFQGRNTPDAGFQPGGDWRAPAAQHPAQEMLDVLWRIMATRDPATAEHAVRVQRLCVAVAHEIGLEDELVTAVHAAAPVHDIGKLAIPDSLLHRPGPLSREEYEIVQLHAAMGAEILIGIDGCAPLARIVRHHHENWDGTGYPARLRREAIPIGARILAIVDCYDALTSHRPYRQPVEHAEAMVMIVARRGTMYDPAILDAFARAVQRVRTAEAGMIRDFPGGYPCQLRSGRVI